MKLQEYFNHQQNLQLSEAEKLDMYHSILSKQAKRSYLKRRSVLHVKTFTYSSFVVVLLFGFYGVYFLQNQSDTGISTMSSLRTVEAGYVAKVVDFNGTFYIEKDGQTYQSSTIDAGDIVVLQKDAQISFNIDEGTQGKVVGPAKFTIEKKSEDSYRLNLIDGDYVEMKSLASNNVQGVELSVDDILVAQSTKTSGINYQLVKEGGKHIIKNNGAKLIVMNQDSQSKTNVSNKQILAIQGNDVSLFDNFDKFAKAIGNKDLSQTFSLALNTIPTENKEDVVSNDKPTLLAAINNDSDNAPAAASLLSFQPLGETELLSVADTSSKEAKSIPSIDTVVATNKKSVPSLDQTNILENKFNAKFVQNDLQELSIAYLGANGSFASILNNLEGRAKQVASIFNIGYTISKGSEKERLLAVASKLESLKIELDNNYFVPPKYLANIQKAQSWIKYLTSQTLGQSQGASSEDILSNIPGSLKF